LPNDAFHDLSFLAQQREFTRLIIFPGIGCCGESETIASQRRFAQSAANLG